MGGSQCCCACTPSKGDASNPAIAADAPLNLHKARAISENGEPTSASLRSDTAMLVDLRAALKQSFKTRKSAFNKLGGSDDSKIDIDEFTQFLTEEMEYHGDIAHLFYLLDANHNGVITLGEFKKFWQEDGEVKTKKASNSKEKLELSDDDVLDELVELVKKHFKTRSDAFRSIAGEDGRIELSELKRFIKGTEGFSAGVKRAFSLLDTGGDGTISEKEFFQLWARTDDKTDEEIIHALQAFLKTKFTSDAKGIQKAFVKLGAHDDEHIEKHELRTFLIEGLKYPGPVGHVGRAFQVLDKNQGGSITKDEFMHLWVDKETDKEVLEIISKSLKRRFETKADAFDAMGALDDHVISEHEFCAFLKDKLQYEGSLVRAFELVDVNGSGTITRKEFQALWPKDKSNEELIAEVRNLLKQNYTNVTAAFHAMGGKGDHQVSRKEFDDFLTHKLDWGTEGDADRVFDMITDDKQITIGKFKIFWGHDTVVAERSGSVSSLQ
eukprot:gnl/MRDRNA2_/MRDRNA2_56929_c0_seq1.p1 gnl/MRDRNA2_/MRDRNA2_56929_c0~~gnl/MRDRNA2_/MRDRNA2_56929_c0_seq1.p1  ORF type:complete len:496 (+),score=131.57 gnl/MRDRNA2_/MRDRNA2_56929_c0_seq1:117-1604(+)